VINVKKIKGIFPILYTFFNKNNSIDFKLMEDQISLIFKQGSHGIAALGLATEVNKLSLKEKTKIIEIVSKFTPNKIPKAITIQAKNYNDYVDLINISKSNNVDWLILQPIMKKNITNNDCYNFFKNVLPLTKGTLTGVQNAKEYIGVGLSTCQINKLYKRYDNFRAIKGEASSYLIQKEIQKYPKDLIVFNGRGGLEIIDNFKIGCKGIVPCLDGADKFIKIYQYFKQNKLVNAEREYKDMLPKIVFIMQSIDSLICYGKRVCAYRMGVKKVYDREPYLRPTNYGIKKSKNIANSLGYF
tara:strand:+ start:2692 stop:3591 length:900 start_codon:yes stop_codon:yes gene_type:complete